MAHINIVLASNQFGVQGLAVTVRSTLEHCTCTCNIYILSSNISQLLKDKLIKSWDTDITGDIKFIDINQEIIQSFRLVHKNLRHKETYLKYFLGDLLPQELTRCIFMDIDLLVSDDLCRLNQINIDNQIMAAALDISAKDEIMSEKRQKIFGLKQPDKYFNSGLFVVNLVVWRANDTRVKLQNFVQENYSILQAMDQDAFNVVLEDKWVEVEQRWNLSQYSSDATVEHKGIIHLIGPTKPWHADYNYKFKDVFFEVLDRTVFKDKRPRKLFGLVSLYRKIYNKAVPYDVFVRKIRKEVKKLVRLRKK